MGKKSALFFRSGVVKFIDNFREMGIVLYQPHISETPSPTYIVMNSDRSL